MTSYPSPSKKSRLVSDLISANSDLSDITIICSDGDRIPAAKFLLSARSDFFRKMLHGHFVECSKEEIELGYNGNVLRSIVRFCVAERWLPDDIEEAVGPEELVSLVCEIAHAAHFFAIPDLEEETISFLENRIEEAPPSACVVLDVTNGWAGFTAASLRRKALRVIRYRPRDALLPQSSLHGRGVLSIRAEVLQNIIADPCICTDEAVIFQCILKWSQGDDIIDSTRSPLRRKCRNSLLPSNRLHHDVSPSSPEHGALSTDSEKYFKISPEIEFRDRREAAKYLASKINLSAIPPSVLCGQVSQSGLVSPNSIVSALTAQALRAEKSGFCYSKTRSSAEPKGKLAIHGAGVDAVNGYYRKLGKFEGVPTYTKNGTWKGSVTRFTIFRVTTTRGQKRWYISVVPTNFAPGTDNDRDFYYLESDYDSPLGSSRMWMIKEEGQEPPPTCSFVWDEDNNIID